MGTVFHTVSTRSCADGEAIIKLESLVQYMDEYLGTEGHPDYSGAINGLQVQSSRPVRRIAAAVDASLASIRAASEAEADLLLVHHGLFWDGPGPLTGRRYGRIKALLDADLGLYSSHLPLDAHPEVGNCALLAESLGLVLEGRFGDHDGAPIGWHGRFPEPVPIDDLVHRTGQAVSSGVQAIPGGPDFVQNVAVLTGGGGSFTAQAAASGFDALVTGEGAHHNYFDAAEFGIHLLLAGHYATETFGVKALAAHVSERFSLEWVFLDLPTGL